MRSLAWGEEHVVGGGMEVLFAGEGEREEREGKEILFFFFFKINFLKY